MTYIVSIMGRPQNMFLYSEEVEADVNPKDKKCKEKLLKQLADNMIERNQFDYIIGNCKASRYPEHWTLKISEDRYLFHRGQVFIQKVD